MTVETAAQGNSLSGAVENGVVTVQSNQDMRGDVVATTDVILGGDTDGEVNATTPGGRQLSGGQRLRRRPGRRCDQIRAGDLVTATTAIGDGNARLHGGARGQRLGDRQHHRPGRQASLLCGSRRSDVLGRSVRADRTASETQYIPAAASVGQRRPSTTPSRSTATRPRARTCRSPSARPATSSRPTPAPTPATPGT